MNVRHFIDLSRLASADYKNNLRDESGLSALRVVSVNKVRNHYAFGKQTFPIIYVCFSRPGKGPSGTCELNIMLTFQVLTQ